MKWSFLYVFLSLYGAGYTICYTAVIYGLFG